jgi:tRNA1Val (adenine37-N6)-methyltransferase
MGITLDTIRDIKIYQSKHGYRFSVDALLLYSFVNLPVVKRFADLGAGSGIIGLLLAKKYPVSRGVLIELQGSLVRHAEENVRLNSLEDRIRVIGFDVRKITERAGEAGILEGGRYDLVVSNPPFRGPKTGLLSPEEERAVARHEIMLKLPELVSAARTLLRPRGRLFLIHHPERLGELLDTLKEKNLELKRLRFVHSHMCSEAKMVLVEAVKEGRAGVKVERPLCLYDAQGAYTDEVQEICYGTLQGSPEKEAPSDR